MKSLIIHALRVTLCAAAVLTLGVTASVATATTAQASLTPSQPSASSYSSYVYLSWPSVSGANKYAIYRSTSSTWSWSNTKVGETYNTYYYDYSAVSGRTYYYWVCPMDYTYTYCNASKWVKVTHGTIDLVAPQPSGSGYSSYAYLSWSSVSGANKYAIYRSTSSTFSWSGTKIGETYGTYYYDYSVAQGKTYYYWVCPMDYTYTYANKSRWVKITIPYSGLVPPQPSVSNTSSGPKITWSSVSGANKYAIYRSTTSTWSWSNKKLGETYSTSYTDTSAVNGTYYYYWVCPMDYNYTYASASKWYCIKCEKTVGGDLVPVKPVVSYTYSSFIYISWASVPGAKDYAVYRATYNSTSYNSTAPTFSWTGTPKLGNTSNCYYYDYNTTPGVIYYYWIGPRDANYTYVNKSLWDWGWRKTN